MILSIRTNLVCVGEKQSGFDLPDSSEAILDVFGLLSQALGRGIGASMTGGLCGRASVRELMSSFGSSHAVLGYLISIMRGEASRGWWMFPPMRGLPERRIAGRAYSGGSPRY